MSVDTKYVIVLGIGSAYQKNKKKSRCSLKKKKKNSTLEKKGVKKSGLYFSIDTSSLLLKVRYVLHTFRVLHRSQKQFGSPLFQ